MHEHLVDLVIATVRVPSTTSASGETQDAGVENDVVMVEGWNTRPVHLGGGGGGGGGSEGGEGGGEGGGGGGEGEGGGGGGEGGSGWHAQLHDQSV